MTAILALLKLVPLKDWLYIGAGLVLTVGLLSYNHHERAIGRQQSAAEIATYQNQLSLAQAANASAGTAIKALETKLAECEKGRLVDKAAQDDAQKAYARAIELFKAGDAAARVRTAKLLQGDCKAWAAQPACGVA